MQAKGQTKTVGKKQKTKPNTGTSIVISKDNDNVLKISNWKLKWKHGGKKFSKKEIWEVFI